MDSVPTGPMEGLKKMGEIIKRQTCDNEYQRFLMIQEECRFRWQTTVDKLAQLTKQREKYASENVELRAELKHISGLWMMENQERRNVEKERDFLKMKMKQTYMYLRPNHADQGGENSGNKTYCIDDGSTSEIASTASFLSNLSDVSSTQYEPKPVGTSNGSQSSEEVNPVFIVTPVQVHEVGNKEKRGIVNKISQSLGSHLPQKAFGIKLHSNNKQPKTMTYITNDIAAENRKRLRSPSKPTKHAKNKDEKEKTQFKKDEVDSNPIYERIDDDSLLLGSDDERTQFEKLFGSFADKPTENILFFQFDTNPDPDIDPHKCQHTFSHRSASRSVVCFLCTKKFRFGILAFQCKSCKIFVHHDCKSQMKLAAKTRWSMINTNGSNLLNYVTSDGPCVPALIVHCVNEVETRGLFERGIYRVSGSEKEVKALKDRFLKSNGTPDLSNVDMHVICGCIKTFLRGLSEPLIPTNQWDVFANFVIDFDGDSIDGNIMKNLQSTIGKLPRANRDTLAFLVLHLQRVATCKAVQMPISNLAKVFGPTVVGYSKSEPDHAAILGETIIQQKVMEHFLLIPTDYWFSFICEEMTSK